MKVLALILLVLTLALALSWTALAQGDFGLTWWSLDGGGGTSSGGAYVLEATIGQPDAGMMVGGAYALGGGLWGSRLHNLRLPLMRR